LKQLTESGSQPAWSPDGTRIAFGEWVSGLFVMAADGSGRRKVADATPHNGISWSPDGERIVFSGPSEDSGALFVVGADGAGLVQITDPGGESASDERPVWAPDGRIYFTRVEPPSAEEQVDGAEVGVAPGCGPRWPTWASPFRQAPGGWRCCSETSTAS
jgi:Tol biopolymer transport system component